MTPQDLPSLPVTQSKPATCAGPNCAVSPGSACAWQPIESAPKDGTEIIILFDSATVDVVRLCWWDDGAPQPWQSDKPQPRPDDVGWWSYKHSVTQEQIDWMTPVAWMPMPDWSNTASLPPEGRRAP